MRLSPSRLLILALAVTLAGCGKGGSTDTAAESELTLVKGATLIEGTTNDASALEGAAESGNVVATAPANATDGAAEPGNAM